MVETAAFKIVYPHDSSVMRHLSYFADWKLDTLVSHISFSCFSSIIYAFLCSTDKKIEFRMWEGVVGKKRDMQGGEEREH